ncbi:MAG: Tex family protein [Stappiaceae bacterium]
MSNQAGLRGNDTSGFGKSAGLASSRTIAEQIADEIGCKPGQVQAVIDLLDDGSTVPFIARYRKEATGGLDDGQLRLLDERLIYMRELNDRRQTILKSIDEQGKLTETLAESISAANSKSVLEDLYLPYRPKRRTKAQIAREAGLEPLAMLLIDKPDTDLESAAKDFLNAEAGFPDTKKVLEGARSILVERLSEDAKLVGRLRSYVNRHGVVYSSVVKGKEGEGEKFADYFSYEEKLEKIPSHRALALFRGRNEGILSVKLDIDRDDDGAMKPAERMVAEAGGIVDRQRSADKWLIETARWAWRTKIALHLELDLMGQLRQRSEEEAIAVFARNLKDLLLAAPGGARRTMGLDPGIRTGIKVAIVDETGKVLDTATVYPFAPRNDVQGTLATLRMLAERHNVDLIAIGNGTASRETDKLAAMMIKEMARTGLTKVMVNEAGASVYSASALAAAEMPDLDVSLRGAVSIARRLQDPLAELVKIEPKAIGVGQYQHDVDQNRLARALDAVVEDAVNAVGVDLNMASGPLLARISGLTENLANAVVEHRERVGAFRRRKQLLDVPRLGPRAFEQCAGFLRIADGDEPLDASTVHPEAYSVTKKIIKACGRDVRDLMGDSARLSALDPAEFVSDKFGLPTIKDILSELEKPGRDPRPEFRTATFQDGVEKISDLKPGMGLEGTVTNVTNFGAFVDIGVHQDGLVHISQLADRFVDDPHKVVKTGDIVRVRVMDVDVQRKRIALSMKKDVVAEPKRQADPRNKTVQKAVRGSKPVEKQQSSKHSPPDENNAMAAALAKAFNKNRNS